MFGVLNKYYIKMKRLIVLIGLLLIVLSATCQKDKIFTTQVTFQQGFKFGDGTIMTTAATGVGTVTWDAIADKPLTFSPSAHNQAWSTITLRPTTLSGYGITDAALATHNHNSLYKPLSWFPTWANVLEKPAFATVATTGSYNDLNNKPATQELADAISTLPALGIPVHTQTEINNMNPASKNGDIVLNSTEGIVQIYYNGAWRIFATVN
jgi:hypothetical protein